MFIDYLNKTQRVHSRGLGGDFLDTPADPGCLKV
jgi:hypothetical protein